jgi:hypothetical protein
MKLCYSKVADDRLSLRGQQRSRELQRRHRRALDSGMMYRMICSVHRDHEWLRDNLLLRGCQPSVSLVRKSKLRLKKYLSAQEGEDQHHRLQHHNQQAQHLRSPRHHNNNPAIHSTRNRQCQPQHRRRLPHHYLLDRKLRRERFLLFRLSPYRILPSSEPLAQKLTSAVTTLQHIRTTRPPFKEFQLLIPLPSSSYATAL